MKRILLATAATLAIAGSASAMTMSDTTALEAEIEFLLPNADVSTLSADDLKLAHLIVFGGGTESEKSQNLRSLFN